MEAHVRPAGHPATKQDSITKHPCLIATVANQELNHFISKH